MQYGWLRYDQMRYEEAEGIFGRIAATPNPIQAKAWEWKIRSMRMQGKYDAADGEISTALAKFKDNADLEVQRGRIQFDQKHYAAAADILWRIAKRNPGNANAWEWRIRSLKMCIRDRSSSVRPRQSAGGAGVPGGRGKGAEGPDRAFDQAQRRRPDRVREGCRRDRGETRRADCRECPDRGFAGSVEGRRRKAEQGRSGGRLSLIHI